MIYVKKQSEIEKMRRSAKVTALALAAAERYVKAGMTTLELDKIIEDVILTNGAQPSFKGYNGFKHAACISIDEVVVHGIPGMRVIKEGELVSVDVGAYLDGYHSDAARTFMIGSVDETKRRLSEVTKESFFKALEFARPGFRIGDISCAVGSCAAVNGFSPIRVMVGHGIGRKLHEDPAIPNFGARNTGDTVKAGHCYAIEPMLAAGDYRVVIESDGWTCRTVDRSPAAHYENTVVITDGQPEILTLY